MSPFIQSAILVISYGIFSASAEFNLHLLHVNDIHSRQSFPRLKATSAFHEHFGWNSLLRIFFFHQILQKNVGFLKIFKTVLFFFSESTLLLSASWVVLQSIFLKKSHLLSFLMKKRKFSKNHFCQKVGKTDRSPSA